MKTHIHIINTLKCMREISDKETYSGEFDDFKHILEKQLEHRHTKHKVVKHNLGS